MFVRSGPVERHGEPSTQRRQDPGLVAWVQKAAVSVFVGLVGARFITGIWERKLCNVTSSISQVSKNLVGMQASIGAKSVTFVLIEDVGDSSHGAVR